MTTFEFMQKIRNLLSLRLTQAVRFIKETGIGITILALFLLTGGILGIVEKCLEVDQMYSLAAVVLVIITIDRIRTDKNFLNQIFGGRTAMAGYLIAEYLLIFSPLILYKLINSYYLTILAIVGTIIILSYITTLITKPINQGYKRSFNLIPLKYFEAKFFVEKNSVSFILIISLLFLGAVHISLWILGIFILMSYIMEMFAAQEPIEMVEWKPGFVSRKILDYFMIVLPILVISSALTYARTELSIIIFLYGICTILTAIALAISNKYSEYYGLTDKIKSTMPMTIIAFLMLLPGFIVVTIGYTIIKYRKAEFQMKHICSR